RVERGPVGRYAGRRVPREVVACAPPGAVVRNTAGMDLDAIVAAIGEATALGRDVARVHSGDPSLYGATAEQMRRLDALAIPYEVVPGVSSFQAAAAALRLEFTPAGKGQTVILTRAAGKTGVAEGERPAERARHKAARALVLWAARVPEVVDALTPHYGPDAPVVIAYRVSRPDERLIRCTLADLAERTAEAGITRTALFLVGPMLDPDGLAESHLY